MEFLQRPIFTQFPMLTVMALVDILVVAFLIYQVIVIIRGRRGGHVLLGFLILAALYVVSLYSGLELLRSLLATLAPYTIFGLIVMFQSEIRSILARLGRRRWFISFENRLETREFADEIVLAVERMAQQRTGALIIIERDIGLRTFIESGVRMDAYISSELLLSIFQRNASLHDGAVIIQGDRVAAAACFLPLSTNPAIAIRFGTRHRAGIGITEETDCLAIIVSEETGSISIATFGEIETDVPLKRVELKLTQHFVRRSTRIRTESRSSDESEVPERAEKR
jgi:diadenylate cyclase